MTDEATNIYMIKANYKQRESGQWAVYYISPQGFFLITFLYVGVTTLGTLMNFDWLVYYVECTNVLTNNFRLQKG